MNLLDFYCKKCDLDQRLIGFKNGYSKRLAERFRLSCTPQWFENICKKCHGKVIRYITQKLLDPYFSQSKKLRYERKLFDKDLVQPGDPRFAVLYPQQHKKMREEREGSEQTIIKEHNELKESYKKIKHLTADPSLLKEVRKAYFEDG